MHIADLGRVLIAMSVYANKRAEQRQDYLGTHNCELLYALAHMLHAGAEACITIAKEK